MKVTDFDFKLPKNLIAQKPTSPRDHSRLLVLDRNKGLLKHRHFYDLIDYLEAGDVLILNNSKVFPARLLGKKKETGGKLEIFLLSRSSFRIPGQGEAWRCLVGGRGGREGLELDFGSGLRGKILANNQDGTWEISFNKRGRSLMTLIKRVGQVPLPPYIKRRAKQTLAADKGRYQTVYADEKKLGSAAAPTAGLHFTPALLKRLKAKKILIEYVTLHVGLGTFAPVKTERIEDHKMHSEWAEMSGKTMARILKAKKEGHKVMAVGTTSVRVLESAFARRLDKKAGGFAGWTDIFIHPPYSFRAVDALVTNFHLPKSTLLMLVAALAGQDRIGRAYRSAIREKYRFFSYGDAMLIK